MKLLVILTFTLLASFNLSKAGKLTVFSHKDARVKKMENQKVVVVATGTKLGLKLQIHPKNKQIISIPKDQSFVIDPLGNKIFLVFSQRENKIKWLGEFIKPLKRVQGTYTYNITFTLDGKPHHFTHRIKYSIYNSLITRSSQVDAKKEKPIKEANKSQ